MDDYKYLNSLKKNYDLPAYISFLKNSVDEITSRVSFKPEIAIVLGSGLDSLVKDVQVVEEIPFGDISDFPIATNKSHDGRFVFGTLCGVNVVCLKGRLHYYEGYDMWDVVAPLRICHMLGADKAIITNAVGAINPKYNVGDFMIVKDGLSCFSPSPLVGPNIDMLGDRFVDMTNMYDTEYIKIAHEVANELNISIHEGIQVQTCGPQFETATEIKMYAMAGADSVGMSSVCETIAARHMNMRVLGLNFISNMACGITNEGLSGEDIDKASKKFSSEFIHLIKAILPKL